MHESKVCPKCNIGRPLDRYYPYHGQCKNCLSVWQREYFRKHPHKRRRDNRAKFESEDYDSLFAEQGGLCAICGTDKPGGKLIKLAVDHCHATGKIRGLLCHCCNTGLGLFRDNPETLSAAILYLQEVHRVRRG